MNYHKNSYTGSPRKKLIIRVLIVVGALVAVAAATLAYGNYLKSKAANTDVSGTGAGRNAQVSGVGRNPSGDVSRAKGVRSICVPREALDESERAAAYVDGLAEGGATGITVLLVDRDGVLTYDSEAVAKLTHQKNTADARSAAISAAIARAKEHSMQTSAVIFAQEGFDESSFAAEIDALVAGDAAALGFDELVVVLPLDAASLTKDGTDAVAKYLAALSEKKSRAALGVCLAFEIFASPELSPQIEVISAGADFLALDLSAGASDPDSGARIVEDAVERIAGSFTLYSLRTVFGGSDEQTATAQIKALADGGFENYMFVTALPNAIPKDDETDTTYETFVWDAPVDEPQYEEPADDEPQTEAPATEPAEPQAPATDAPEPEPEATTAAPTPATEAAAPQTDPPAPEPPATEAAAPQTEPEA